MTMDLRGPGGERRFNLMGWSMLLDLALLHGWKPAGLDRSQREAERAAEDEAEGDYEDEDDGDYEDEDDEDYEDEYDGDEEEDEDDETPALELNSADYALPHDDPLAKAITSMFPPAEDRLLTSYFLNDGYRMKDEDAAALADALERALPDVPDHDALEHKTFEHPAEPGVRLIDARTPVTPFEWFSAKKDLLRDFIAYCRQGGFEIW